MIVPKFRGRSLAAAAMLCALGAAVSLAQSVQQPPPPAADQSPAPAAQVNAREARFALIIGNDGYDNAPLPTAAQDAGLIADTLKAAGFDVMGARNVDQDTFRASYREFLQKVAGAGDGGVAFVYVSGYGVQYEGENFLVPTGVTIERETDLALNAIRISDLTRPMGSLPARVKMVVLDVAYQGPFGKQVQLAPGLALATPEPGMLLAFNASPGTFAPEARPPYGSYAQALAEMMREGGLQLGDVFDRTRLRVSDLSRSTQIPWDASLVEDQFVFFERRAGEPAAGATEVQLEAARTKPLREMTPDEAYAAALARDDLEGYQEFLEAFPNSPYAKNVQGILAARRESATWQRATVANSPNAYWTYMKRYPRGPHVPDARRRLARISSPVEPPPEFETVAFDVPPPPPAEYGYFETSGVSFLEPVSVPAVSFYAPPPSGWWAPPPPPVLAPDDYYFLPLSASYAPPPYVYVPDYVYAPPVYAYPAGYGYLPYVAAPAFLIAAISAGRLFPRAFAGRPFRPGILPPAARGAQRLALAPRQQGLAQQRPGQMQRLNNQRNQVQQLNQQRQLGQQQRLNQQQQQQNQQRQNLQNPQQRNLQQQQQPNAGQRNLQQQQPNAGQRNLQQQQPNAGQRNLQQQPNAGQRNLQQQNQQQQRVQQRQQQQQLRQQQNQQRLQQNQQRVQQRQQFQQQRQIQQRPQIQQRQQFQQRPQFQQRQQIQQRPQAQQRQQFQAPRQQIRAPVQQFRAPVQRSAPSGGGFRRR